MSVLGTGIAAGVAQTAQNAQQVARNRDRKAADRAYAERAEQQSFQLHLSSASETRDADDEMPDKPTPMYERIWEGEGEGDNGPDAPEDAAAAQPDPNQLPLYPAPGERPLYHHLDVQA